MTEPGRDPRPAPQYGEYATPEEVAAARGPLPVEHPEEHGTVGPSTLAQRLSTAPPPRGDRVASRRPAGRWNAPITAFLLTLGAWFTISSIPGFLRFGSVLSQALAMYGITGVSFGPVAQTAGVVLLVVSLLLLIGAIGLSVLMIRRGRRSVWIPLLAGILMFLAYLVTIYLVVANTPGATDLLQNR
ncbi:DUF6264 family protein [Lysinimonas soli]|uniref:DUF6264 family protein n=1 Tax=Lysinimonas soli TaxID=1074233 RepID=A0ABW0NMZ9_9MICO